MSLPRGLRRAAAPLRRWAVPSLSKQPSIAACCVAESVEAGGLSRLRTLVRAASTAREVSQDADHGLLRMLKRELDHERKTYSQPRSVAMGPPEPWTLTDKKGHADVILRRSFGSEDIALTCVYQPDAYAGEGDDDRNMSDQDDDDRQDNGSASVTLTVTINKGEPNPTLELSATSYGTEISIDHVYFWEDKETKETLYDGPNFCEQLDEELQSHFEKYLKARGVNRDLIGYLFKLLEDKEQREYMRWLQNVEKFVHK